MQQLRVPKLTCLCPKLQVCIELLVLRQGSVCSEISETNLLLLERVLIMPAIGIDLGTTYSCVGVFQNGKVEIIANDQGNRTTPSFVAFTDTVMLIGDPATSQVDCNPENTVFGVKRLIGRKFNVPEIAEGIEHWPFKVCDIGGKPKIRVMYKGEHKLFTPEEISALVLSKMKETAEMYLGEKVTDAVITVPASFNDSQRQATKDAGTIAGLHVLGIINEPTAAALAYGLDRDIKDERNVLMFDLGGGTFDASIVAIQESVFEVKATAGNTCLGGEDFDNRMVSLSVGVFASHHAKNLCTNARAIQRLKTACERAKRTLSSSEEVSIKIEALFEGIDHYSKIKRSKFEEQCTDLLCSTLELVKKALTDAKIDKSSIHDIVLVGGSTQIPEVQELLRDHFGGKELCMSLNVDEAVAYGAAVQAAVLAGGKSEKICDLLIADVIPFSLAVETGGGVMTKIMQRNSCIPRETCELFTTYSDNQSSITIKVFEGDRALTEHNHFLGKFELSDIPPARGGVPRIEVTFVVDANGILHVSACDQSSGELRKICVTSDKGRLTREEINRMFGDRERYQQEDEKQREKVSALNSLEAYVYSAKQAAVFADDSKFSPVEIKEVSDICENAMKWLGNNTLAEKEETEYKMKEVKGQLSPIMRKLHQDGPHNCSSSGSHSTRSVMTIDMELSP